MPFKSDAQRGAMYAAAAGKSTIGIPQDAARKFVQDSVRHSTGTKSKLKDAIRKRKEQKK